MCFQRFETTNLLPCPVVGSNLPSLELICLGFPQLNADGPCLKERDHCSVTRREAWFGSVGEVVRSWSMKNQPVQIVAQVAAFSHSAIALWLRYRFNQLNMTGVTGTFLSGALNPANWPKDAPPLQRVRDVSVPDG